MGIHLKIGLTAILMVCGLLPACTQPELKTELRCDPVNGNTLQADDTAVLNVVVVSGNGPFTYEWTATRGNLNPDDGLAAIYTPPEDEGGDVVISVKVSNGQQVADGACTYKIMPVPTPTPTITPTSTATPTLTPTPTVTPTPLTPLAAFQKGFILPSWWSDHYCESEFGLAAIQRINELGADWIQLVPTWYMDDRSATEIKSLDEKTSTDECLERAIRTSHEVGLDVMLKPHVDSLDGYFRGEIAPSDPEKWFESYGKMILHYADIAHENEVEIFVVGTELKSLSEHAHTEKWRMLISQVRQRYFNRLTYSANWDDYAQIEFWDDLDYIGIDAYFPLSDLDDPSMEDILAGWQSYTYQQVQRHWIEEIQVFSQAEDKQVLFTEIGYGSQDGAAVQPWSQENSQPNHELQARLYEAALRTFWNQPNFKGFYWWLWDMQPDPRYEVTGYMPKEAALQQIKRWYAFDPPEMPPSLTLSPTLTVTPMLTSTVINTPTPMTQYVVSPEPIHTLPADLGPDRVHDFESCTTEGWMAETFDDSQGIESVVASGDAAMGSCSLQLNAQLQAQHGNFSKGEAFIELSDPFNFTGETITCFVYAPNEEAKGPANSPNGAQLFVKNGEDEGFSSEYSSWFNLDQGGWIEIRLTPSNSAPPGGFMSEDFNPSNVVKIGVKIGTGGQTSSEYSYNGPFYLDNCSW